MRSRAAAASSQKGATMDHTWIEPAAGGATFRITTREPNGRSRQANATITFGGPAVVRYRLAPVDAAPPPKFPLTRDPGWPEVHAHVDADDAHALLTVPGGPLAVLTFLQASG